MRSPLKWPGGLSRIADRLWAIASTRPHLHRVEPYAGGLSFTLASEPQGYSEVVNDLHGGLSNFWRVLANPHLFNQFERRLQGTTFGEAIWNAPEPSPEYTVEAAVWFFAKCRMSLMGGMKAFAPLSRNRTRRGMNEQVSAWLTAVEGLPQVHARLRRVAVLNRPALDVIRTQDGPNTLFFCDPPWMPETRAANGMYEHEMSEVQHSELLATLHSCEGSVMLMGRRCPLYDSLSWHRYDFELPNDMGQGRMVTCCWTNWSPSPDTLAQAKTPPLCA